MPKKVLLITHDLIADKMAGPAIRCCELARQLAPVCEVTVTSRLPVQRLENAFDIISYDSSGETLITQASEADILIVQGTVLRKVPGLARLGKFLVVDLYDPIVLESYPFFNEQGIGRDAMYLEYVALMDEQMLKGDFFVCASDRQRDMWLGRFCTLGRLTPEIFNLDPSLKRLIDLVPFGLQDVSPEHRKPVLRGVVPGVGQDDFVMLWGGGVWNWFDPLSIIQAVAELNRTDVKLYFLGIKHPSPDAPESQMAHRAITLAKELGVYNRNVFFNTSWVPYDDRQNYLLEADVGVTAHFDSIETRFSFRTRVLDYLWAGLPIITTTGDSMAELVSNKDLGAVVGYEDVEGWKQAISALADDRDRRRATSDHVKEAAQAYRWSVVAQPLIDYCREPYRNPSSLKRQGGPSGTRTSYLMSRAAAILKNEGPRSLWRKGLGYLNLRS